MNIFVLNFIQKIFHAEEVNKRKFSCLKEEDPFPQRKELVRIQCLNIANMAPA